MRRAENVSSRKEVKADWGYNRYWLSYWYKDTEFLGKIEITSESKTIATDYTDLHRNFFPNIYLCLPINSKVKFASLF